MPRERRASRWAVLALVFVAIAGRAEDSPKAGKGTGLGFAIDRKQPITLSADTLDYDHKAGVVLYKGGVHVVQGAVTITSDVLRVTLGRDEAGGAASEDSAIPGLGGDAGGRIKEIVAEGHVRIDQGQRFATGGRAVFDQQRRTLVLSIDPVLHDGPNKVAGERVLVYLDEDRSVVEGGRGRVKAVLFPGSDDKDKADAAPKADPPSPKAAP